MISFDIKIDAFKGMFFDRITDAAAKAVTRNLSKFGAFVRRDAKGSIRKTKDHSVFAAPGQAPRSHGEHLLRDKIFFGYDPSAQSVVIGPALINGGTGAPELMERGGTVNRPSQLITVRPREAQGKRGRPTKEGKIRVRIPAGQRVYEPRPFMQPAFDKNMSQIDTIWRDSIRP